MILLATVMNNPDNYDSNELFEAGFFASEHHEEEPVTMLAMIETNPIALDEVAYLANSVTSTNAAPTTDTAFPIEPVHYKDAVQAPDAQEWKKAMQDEINSLKKLKVWELVPRPDSSKHKVLKGRWVFKCKLGDKNQLLKRKARFVVKGFMQVYGRDFSETHAPVAKMKSILLMLSIAAKDDLELHQLDFDTAFLNATVQDTVFMEQPEGFHEGSVNLVLRLLKALYGLKQAPHEWNKCINQFLKELGWNPLTCDSCVYVKYSKSGRLMLICLYVDDTVVCFHVEDKQEWFDDKKRISDKFAIKDLGECNWILNMKVVRNREKKTICLTQQAYVEKMVKSFGFGTVRNNPSVPVTDDLTFPPLGQEDVKLGSNDQSLYQSLVGSLALICSKYHSG